MLSGWLAEGSSSSHARGAVAPADANERHAAKVWRIARHLRLHDAARPLSELGFDPSLNFALGSGQPDAYRYEWYLNAIAPENLIGAGRTLAYRPTTAAGRDGGGVFQTIVLRVRDTAATLSTPTSVSSFQIRVAPTTYLPLIGK